MGHARKGTLPNFFQLWAGNHLKRAVERQHGRRYTCVIRLRPDTLLKGPLPPHVVSGPSNVLWYSDYELHPSFQVSDKLAVAPSSVMDYYASIWLRLRRFWQRPLGDDPP